MNSFKKNQVIIAALAIMIALAAYLSFVNKSSIDEGQYVFNNESSVLNNDNNIMSLSDLTDSVTISKEEDKEEVDENTETSHTVSDEKDVDEQSDQEEKSEATASVDDGKEVGEAVFVNSDAISNTYFLENKLKREQKRAARIEILNEIINNKSLAEDKKLEAISKMIEIQEQIGNEGLAESLLEAKGFEEVFILVDDDSADVIIKVEALDESDLAQIIDVTARKTGIDPEKIIVYKTQ